MRPTSFRLKPGVDPANALGILDELVRRGRGVVAGAGAGTHVGPGALPLAEAYVIWTDDVESQLTSLSLDADLVEALHTSRYWRIRQLHEEPVRPVTLVQSEVDRQANWLEVIQRDLQARIARAAAAPGQPAVIDTNVLLEFQAPAQVDWRSILRATAVRLVIPLRVIEELDIIKYDRRRRERADRARRVLPQLSSALGSAGTPGPLRDGTTIEVLGHGDGVSRSGDADADVLATCQELEQFSGRRVTLISGDNAIRIRAEALAMTAIPMPDGYSSRPAADPAAVEDGEVPRS